MGVTNSKAKDNIPWVDDLEKGQLIASFTRKPLMLMILKSWCPTCRLVYPKYCHSQEFQDLSKHFVMVKCIDEKTIEKKYAPDGHYIPRILFFSPDGQLLQQFYNVQGSFSQAVYFYPKIHDLLNTMRNVLLFSHTKHQYL